jgi:uncharacterized membrane protein YfcA
MGVLGFFLSVPAAMILHGVAQTASNGSRIILHRRHLRWNVFVPYTVGSLVTLAFFVGVTLVPNKAVIFIVIGSFPFLGLLIPSNINLDIEKKPIALLCGIIVTAVQLLAGASGPVLDIFYVKSKLNRFEILGTKAITQTLGHVLKLLYYAFFLNLTIDLPSWLFPAVVAAAIFGNWIGKMIIQHLNDEAFKKAGRSTILVIGIIYICKGIAELL